MFFVVFMTLSACSESSEKQQTSAPMTTVENKGENNGENPSKQGVTSSQGSVTKKLPPRPKAKIGGTPILTNPIVLGGVSKDHVKEVMKKQNDAIQGCHATSKTTKGKVLIKFSIQKDGTVSSTLMESTSLRDSETENCLTDLIKTFQFDPLEKGSKAIIRYPLIIE